MCQDRSGKVVGGSSHQKQCFRMGPGSEKQPKLENIKSNIENAPGTSQERRKQYAFDFQSNLHEIAVRLTPVSLKSVG